MSDEKPTELMRITRIERPDPDHFALIHLAGGSAFGCGRQWFDENQPEVGDIIAIDANNRRRRVVHG